MANSLRMENTGKDPYRTCQIANSIVKRHWLGYLEFMKSKSFKEIRTQYPNEDDYLVLVDCTTKELPSGEIEVTEAKHVEPFKDFRAMYDAYKEALVC